MVRGLVRAALLAAVMVIPGVLREADAAGFAIRENSAEALGTAFAGNASSATFLSTIYNNPAGMTQFTGDRAQLDASALIPSMAFTGSATAHCAYCGPAGAPISGGGNDGGQAVFVPAGYAMISLSPDLKAGLALTSPYGLETNYAPDWAGRYFGIKSYLQSLDINPSLAYRVNNWLSVGGGLSAQHLYADLSNALDFSSIAGLPPGTFPDGRLRVHGDGWGWGYNGGLLVQPMDGTNIGLTYRSRIQHTITGNASFADVSYPFSLNPAFASGAARTSLTTPATAEISVTQRITDKLHLSADVQWTGWSSFQSLGVQNASGGNLGTPTQENWHDTVYVALGGTYNWDDNWTFRSGIAYDQSPVSDQYRTVRLPDADRYWLSFGVGYKFSDGLSVDLGYTHIFMPNASISNSVNSTQVYPGGTDVIAGSYKLHIDLVSLQTRFRF